MTFKDVREFIGKLEKEKELQRIEEEVDWNLEVGAMLRRSAEKGLPAPFFQKIKDYPEGYRIFGGGAAKFSRMAIAMDLNPGMHPRDIMEVYLQRKQHPIKPVMVKDAPCKENIHLGDDVNLFEFPVPFIHGGDGGRYIGTWHATINKDPESGWVNWGMYRHMVHDKNTAAILMATPSKHLWSIYNEKYRNKGIPMEVAIAIGMDPISTICATAPMPYGVSEVDIAGGIRGEPVELVKCETIDLLVPATSEIVIEGEINFNEPRDEGPFGEFTGYRASERAPRPVIHVKAITHRNNPILTISCMGMPIDDNCVISLTKSADVLELLRRQGFPVTGAYMFPETGYLLVAVSIKPRYYGIAGDVAHAVWGAPIFSHSLPYVIVVEDDVDPFDMAHVLHAVVTKCHPSRGINKIEHQAVLTLTPWLSQSEQKYRMGAKVYFDCTWPVDWDPKFTPQRVSFAEVYPPDIQEKALTKWRRYGY